MRSGCKNNGVICIAAIPLQCQRVPSSKGLPSHELTGRNKGTLARNPLQLGRLQGICPFHFLKKRCMFERLFGRPGGARPLRSRRKNGVLQPQKSKLLRVERESQWMRKSAKNKMPAQNGCFSWRQTVASPRLSHLAERPAGEPYFCGNIS